MDATELPLYAKKEDNGSYTLLRIKVVEGNPMFYKLGTDKKVVLDKIITDVPAFEREYDYLKPILLAVDKPILVTAFYDNDQLYEIYSTKLRLDDYNAQTIDIYEIKGDQKTLVESNHSILEMEKSKFMKYFFIR